MELDRYKTIQDVLDHVKMCEGKHRQQVAFSSYHTALTQVCFDCEKVRTNLLPTKTRMNKVP